MIVTKKSLARRTVLRGLGASLALPFLDAMVPALAGPLERAAKPAVRLGFVYVPNGIMDLNGEWTPKAEGTDFEFAPVMKAIEPFRERLLVLSGLAQVRGRPLGDGAGDHARASATFLTGARAVKTEGVASGRAFPLTRSPPENWASIPSWRPSMSRLRIRASQGGCDSGYSCAYTNTLSWRTETTPSPMEDNPRRVFEHLFGDGESTDPQERQARRRERRTILDFVRGDLSRLRAGLGGGRPAETRGIRRVHP